MDDLNDQNKLEYLQKVFAELEEKLGDTDDTSRTTVEEGVDYKFFPHAVSQQDSEGNTIFIVSCDEKRRDELRQLLLNKFELFDELWSMSMPNLSSSFMLVLSPAYKLEGNQLLKVVNLTIGEFYKRAELTDGIADYADETLSLFESIVDEAFKDEE